MSKRGWIKAMKGHADLSARGEEAIDRLEADVAGHEDGHLAATLRDGQDDRSLGHFSVGGAFGGRFDAMIDRVTEQVNQWVFDGFQQRAFAMIHVTHNHDFKLFG